MPYNFAADSFHFSHKETL